MNPNVEMAVLAGMAEEHRQRMMQVTTVESQLERMRVAKARRKLSESPVPRLGFKLSYAIAIVLLLAMMLFQIVVAAVNAVGSGGGGTNLVR